MNFLVLINGAPKYKYFFAEIAKKIEERGHHVYFAINAKKSSILEPLEYIDKSKNNFFFALVVSFCLFVFPFELI